MCMRRSETNPNEETFYKIHGLRKIKREKEGNRMGKRKINAKRTCCRLKNHGQVIVTAEWSGWSWIRVANWETLSMKYIIETWWNQNKNYQIVILYQCCTYVYWNGCTVFVFNNIFVVWKHKWKNLIIKDILSLTPFQVANQKKKNEKWMITADVTKC